MSPFEGQYPSFLHAEVMASVLATRSMLGFSHLMLADSYSISALRIVFLRRQTQCCHSTID